MNFGDAVQSALLVCSLPALGFAMFTSIMLWFVRPEHRSPRHLVLYFVVSFASYFVFFTLGIWFLGSVMTENRIAS